MTSFFLSQVLYQEVKTIYDDLSSFFVPLFNIKIKCERLKFFYVANPKSSGELENGNVSADNAHME